MHFYSPLTASLALLFLITKSALAENANYYDGDDEYNVLDEEPNMADIWWITKYSELAPFLVGIFFVVLGMHLILVPPFLTCNLMKTYLQLGMVVEGHVLNCEVKPGGSSLEEIFFMVEVMYQVLEHKHSSSRMRLRHPHDMELKKFVRRFRFKRDIPRGTTLDVLILPKQTRSGCPREVAEMLLIENSTTMLKIILVLGSIIVCILIGFAIHVVKSMQNTYEATSVMVIGLITIEVICFFYSGKIFLKSKKINFDSARPVLSSKEAARNNSLKESILS